MQALTQPISDALIAAINETRIKAGYLTLEETIALGSTGNTLFDPFSVLISRFAAMGENNTFYPHVRIQASQSNLISIGDHNTFSSNTFIEADTGPIEIGNDNEFGDGLITIKTNAPDARIEITSFGRYVGNIKIFGQSYLGDGAQILGDISVQSCVLSDGLPHTHPVPNERGSVLKGYGTASGIVLKQGEVIKGSGVFLADDIKNQEFYHPR